MPSPTESSKQYENAAFLQKGMMAYASSDRETVFFGPGTEGDVPTVQSDGAIEFAAPETVPQTLNDLTDVDASSAITGDVLTFNGATWDAQAPSGGSSIDRSTTHVVGSLFESLTRFIVDETGLVTATISDRGVTLATTGVGTASVQLALNTNVNKINRTSFHVSSTANPDVGDSVYVGASGGAEATPAALEAGNFVGFRIVGTGNVFAVCISSGSETAVDTGLTTLQAKYCSIQRVGTESSTTSYEFYVDGVLEATIADDIPPADGLYSPLIAMIDNTGSDSAPQLELESFDCEYVAYTV